MIIEKAESKATADGKPYWRILADGHWMTCWDKKLGPQLLVGTSWEFEIIEKGDFLNIKGAKPGTEAPPSGNGQAAPPPTVIAQGEANRQASIIRQTCLKAAVELVGKLPAVDSLSTILAAAEVCERWVTRPAGDEAHRDIEELFGQHGPEGRRPEPAKGMPLPDDILSWPKGNETAKIATPIDQQGPRPPTKVVTDTMWRSVLAQAQKVGWKEAEFGQAVKDRFKLGAMTELTADQVNGMLSSFTKQGTPWPIGGIK